MEDKPRDRSASRVPFDREGGKSAPLDPLDAASFALRRFGLVRHFFHGVAVPRWHPNLDQPLAHDLALAAQAAVALKPGGLLDAVLFGLGGLREVFHALFDVDVAGGTGAHAAAGVLDVDAVVLGDFEDVLTFTGEDFPLALGGAGEGLGVFEDEGDGDNRWTVGVFAVSKVHGFLENRRTARVEIESRRVVRGGRPGVGPACSLGPISCDHDTEVNT